MPTYDYRCKECGHTIEEFQPMSAEPLVTCPSCGKPGLVRLLSTGAGMIFKGSGFYQTDYKKRGGNGESKSEPKKEAKKESKEESAKKPDSAASTKSEPPT